MMHHLTTTGHAPTRAIRLLYEAIAVRYDSDVGPLVGPLAWDLIDSIPAAHLGRVALDVGTGTGLAAWRLTKRGVPTVIGIDIVPAMLRQARGKGSSPPAPLPQAVEGRRAAGSPSLRRGTMHRARSGGGEVVLADVCQAPFGPRVFDLITASFGLSLTVPRRALAEIRRLLKPGGWLYFQEWAAQDPISRAFDEVFAATTVGTGAEGIEADLPTAWAERFQDADDYREYLTAFGFADVRATESTPVGVRTTSEAFM